MDLIGRCKDCESSNNYVHTGSEVSFLVCTYPGFTVVGYKAIVPKHDGFAMFYDASGFLPVGPEFGCVHFKKRAG